MAPACGPRRSGPSSLAGHLHKGDRIYAGRQVEAQAEGAAGRRAGDHSKLTRLRHKRSATCRRGIVAISEKIGDPLRDPGLGDGGLAWLHFLPALARFWSPQRGLARWSGCCRAEFRTLASDIADGVNFLELERLPDASVRGIVTNPPYERAVEFARMRWKLTAPVKGFVAMLLRCDFDHAKRRACLFADCPQFATEDRADAVHRLVRGSGRQAEGEPQFQPCVVSVGLAAPWPAGHCLRSELRISCSARETIT